MMKMMRRFLVFSFSVIAIFATTSAFAAADLCWKFEPRDKGSQLKNLTLRASDGGKKSVWHLKATALDGHVFTGQVSCAKTAHVSEWTCSRMDGGGSFEALQTGQAARFSTKYFEFGNANDKLNEEKLSLQADENDPWIFRGEVKNCPKPLIGAPPL